MMPPTKITLQFIIKLAGGQIKQFKMKLFFVFALFFIAGNYYFTFSNLHTSRVLTRISFHKIAKAAPRTHSPKWELVPDSVGTFHLIDLSTYEVEPETRYDAANDMVFILFTNANPTVGQVVNLNDAASLAASNFNPANPTRYEGFLKFSSRVKSLI
jgi:pancreatic triacylglycerol lipase